MATTPVYDEAGNAWMVPTGWIANGAGGFIAPDGAHWGATEQPPLRMAGDAWTRQQARERREHRSRSSDERTADSTREAEKYHIIKTPEEEKAEYKEWNTSRYGVTFGLVCDMDRDDLITGGFVSHKAATGNDWYETAEDTSTTEHEQPMESDAVTHTTDEVEAPPVHLGNYDDTPLDVHAGVVAPAACYVVIDGTPWRGHYSPQRSTSWAGTATTEQSST
jgi:hypothetical protein